MRIRLTLGSIAQASTALAFIAAIACGGNTKASTDAGSGSGGSSSGGSSGSSGSGSGGSNDASADVTADASPAPQGLASFSLVVNGASLTPLSCPSDDWEFALPSGEGMPTPACNPVVTSAYLVNTGKLPMPYLAQGLWHFGAHYVPGVATGDMCQLSGVLDPGAKVDITSVYQGGTIALVGSAEPFSSADAGKTVSDETTIPWPAGVNGSGGATTMYVAQIDVLISSTSCTAVDTFW